MDDSLFNHQTNTERDREDEETRRQAGTVDSRRQLGDEEETSTQEYSCGEKFKIFCATCCCARKKKYVMKEYERAVIFRLGRVMKEGARGPGTITVYEGCDKVKKIVDLRETTYLSRPLILETRDNVPIEVLALCFFQIIQPVKVINIQGDDPSQFIQDVSMSYLRDAVVNLSFSDVLKDKDKIEMHMKENVEKQAAKFGVKVICVELLNIKVVEKSKLEDSSNLPSIPGQIVPVGMPMYPSQPQFIPQNSFIQPPFAYTQQPQPSFVQPGMYPPMAYPVKFQ